MTLLTDMFSVNFYYFNLGLTIALDLSFSGLFMTFPMFFKLCTPYSKP